MGSWDDVENICNTGCIAKRKSSASVYAFEITLREIDGVSPEKFPHERPHDVPEIVVGAAFRRCEGVRVLKTESKSSIVPEARGSETNEIAYTTQNIVLKCRFEGYHECLLFENGGCS